VAQRLSPESASVGAVLVSTTLLLRLIVRVSAQRAKLVGHPFGARRQKRRNRHSWTGRLLSTQLGYIARLRQSIEGEALQREISRVLSICARVLSANAQLGASERFWEEATRHVPRSWELRIDFVRALGIIRFMQGRMREALPCFAEVAQTKHMLRSRTGVPSDLRILGDSWFVALGHVAMLDFLLKKQKLGWDGADTIFVTSADLRNVPGQTLLREFQRLGMLFLWPDDLKTVFDRLVESANDKYAMAHNDVRAVDRHRQREVEQVSVAPLRSPQFRRWDYLENGERAALVEEFWETFFPDGDGLPYSHAAAKIQNRWEAEGRPPNLARTAEADAALRILRRQLGIPDSGWYVCLHVRQGGFHRGWNSRWEQARDADISTYSAAMQTIVDHGGYVVRMGDPSMPRLLPAERTIDYAHSEFKSEYADILLLSGARFFVGTNSGLSVVPGVYGVPCVLTNWVPVGLPNWFGIDVVIPKLLRNKASGTFLTLEEMFATDAGYVQNPRDLPPSVEFVDNSPEDIAFAVTQMLCELDGDADRVRDRNIEEEYFKLAGQHGSYRGSRIGTAFIREHGSSLGFWPTDRPSPQRTAAHFGWQETVSMRTRASV
jgi:putative glycosyltransferase (TIGR04372 family)